MTYAELSESQARRSRQFAEAQTDAMSVYCDAERDLKELQAENAKLRELLRKVLQFERAGCKGCPYASTCDVDCLYEPDCPMREDIERDMRELGVDE